MNEKKLSLDQPATYEIRVPGIMEKHWLDWNGRLKIIIEDETDLAPISILTISLDQAELHGLLRHLYSLGIPLISVICQDYL